eukprot:IDg15462t1
MARVCGALGAGIVPALGAQPPDEKGARKAQARHCGVLYEKSLLHLGGQPLNWRSVSLLLSPCRTSALSMTIDLASISHLSRLASFERGSTVTLGKQRVHGAQHCPLTEWRRRRAQRAQHARLRVRIAHNGSRARAAQRLGWALSATAAAPNKRKVYCKRFIPEGEKGARELRASASKICGADNRLPSRPSVQARATAARSCR